MENRRKRLEKDRVVESVPLSQMVLKEEQFPSCQNLIGSDAKHDVIRSRARAANTQSDEEYLRLLKEDDSIEEQYKVILCSLLTMEERPNPHKKKNDKDDVTEHKKRSERLKKRKAKEEIVDDCNGAEEENDPWYELFLQHLKEHDKSYVLESEKDGSPLVIKYEGDISLDKECKYEKHGLPLAIKYEGDISLDKECEPEPEPRRKLNRAHNVVNEKNPRMLTKASNGKSRPSNQARGAESQHKHDPQSISIKEISSAVKVEIIDGLHNDMIPNPKYPLIRQNVKLGGDHNVSMRKGHAVVNEKINDQKREDGRKFLIDMKLRSRFSNQTLRVENQQGNSVKKTKSLARGKSRNETDIKKENPVHRNVKLEDHPHVHMHEGHSVVNENISGVNDRRKQSGRNLDRNMKLKVELSHLMPHSEIRSKLDLQPASAKNTKSLTLKKSRSEARNVWIEKCSPSEFRKVVDANCFMAYKNIEENNLEEGKGGSDSDVEILDDAVYLKKGILNPFVSSKKFSISMEDGIQQIGRSSVCDEFRKAVLNALKKPYDREEYKRRLKSVQAGCYFDYYPDLKRKLIKYRYNKKKRLTILRGFFFWLQNLTQEGAFKPWKDRACLVVELPSP